MGYLIGMKATATNPTKGDTMTTATQTTAREILNQLGGNRFAVMTGARDFMSTGNGVQFRIGRNAKSVNRVAVTLNGLDLYDVMFWNVRSAKATIRSEVENVYADQLRSVFENHTGMYTSF
jgi:hypothetical protein